MTYPEVLSAARGRVGPYCKACPVCSGQGCRNTIPGPGAKGLGTGFIRNYQKWQEICVNMDTIGENRQPDTQLSLFGRTFDLPVFAAPIGAMKLHYGDLYDDAAYNDILVPACRDAGIAAFTGDGVDPAVMAAALHAIGAADGAGVPTIKPWNMELVREKMAAAQTAKPIAIAMDIDAAGLPFLKNCNPPAGSKTVEELKTIVQWAEKPFLLKGIMTVRGAEKALAAGAAGIVVSNHGGRVLGQNSGGRRHPHRQRRVQGAGPRRRRRADRAALRHRRLRRRRRGRPGLRGEAPRRADGHHGHVRRPLPGGDHAGHGPPAQVNENCPKKRPLLREGTLFSPGAPGRLFSGKRRKSPVFGPWHGRKAPSHRKRAWKAVPLVEGRGEVFRR